jgi:hypothetical protein
LDLPFREEIWYCWKYCSWIIDLPFDVICLPWLYLSHVGWKKAAGWQAQCTCFVFLPESHLWVHIWIFEVAVLFPTCREIWFDPPNSPETCIVTKRIQWDITFDSHVHTGHQSALRRRNRNRFEKKVEQLLQDMIHRVDWPTEDGSFKAHALSTM